MFIRLLSNKSIKIFGYCLSELEIVWAWNLSRWVLLLLWTYESLEFSSIARKRHFLDLRVQLLCVWFHVWNYFQCLLTGFNSLSSKSHFKSWAPHWFCLICKTLIFRLVGFKVINDTLFCLIPYMLKDLLKCHARLLNPSSFRDSAPSSISRVYLRKRNWTIFRNNSSFYPDICRERKSYFHGQIVREHTVSDNICGDIQRELRPPTRLIDWMFR